MLESQPLLDANLRFGRPLKCPFISIATYGAAFAGGAIWQGLVQYIAARPSDKPPANLASDLEALIFSLARARQFIATMATLGAVGGAIASSLALPHAAWLLTIALRVMKPSQVETRLRLKHRFIGTSAGALVSADLLGREIPPLLYAGLFGIILTAMQLVRPDAMPCGHSVSPSLPSISANEPTKSAGKSRNIGCC